MALSSLHLNHLISLHRDLASVGFTRLRSASERRP